MWQTKYASAGPKNLGVGVNFRACSEGFFLAGRPQSVILEIVEAFLMVYQDCTGIHHGFIYRSLVFIGVEGGLMLLILDVKRKVPKSQAELIIKVHLFNRIKTCTTKQQVLLIMRCCKSRLNQISVVPSQFAILFLKINHFFHFFSVSFN